MSEKRVLAMVKQEVRIAVGKGLGCPVSDDEHHHWINDYTQLPESKIKVIRCKYCRRIQRIGVHASEDKKVLRWMKKRK